MVIQLLYKNTINIYNKKKHNTTLKIKIQNVYRYRIGITYFIFKSQIVYNCRINYKT